MRGRVNTLRRAGQHPACTSDRCNNNTDTPGESRPAPLFHQSFSPLPDPLRTGYHILLPSFTGDGVTPLDGKVD